MSRESEESLVLEEELKDLESVDKEESKPKYKRGLEISLTLER